MAKIGELEVAVSKMTIAPGDLVVFRYDGLLERHQAAMLGDCADRLAAATGRNPQQFIVVDDKCTVDVIKSSISTSDLAQRDRIIGHVIDAVSRLTMGNYPDAGDHIRRARRRFAELMGIDADKIG